MGKEKEKREREREYRSVNICTTKVNEMAIVAPHFVLSGLSTLPGNDWQPTTEDDDDDDDEEQNSWERERERERERETGNELRRPLTSRDTNQSCKCPIRVRLEHLPQLHWSILCSPRFV